MKKFFATIVLVSTFFIGLGALADRAGATFKSDARALEVIRLARIAIGGDSNINNVRSLTIAGKSTYFFDKDGLQQAEQGNMEINLQLPNHFSKTVKIGNPDDNAGGLQQKRVEVFVTKDGSGNVLTEDVRGAESNSKLPADGVRKIIVKKDDGSIQEINSGDKNVFFKKEGDTQTFKTTDGKTVIINKNIKTEDISGNRNNELFRTTFALLLSAPEGLDVSYVYAGEGNVDGNSCDIIEAQTNGSSYKLYIDQSTHLPRMMSYQAAKPFVIKINRAENGNVGENAANIFVRQNDLPKGEMAEFQIKFSDYRDTNGILLPYKWTQTVGGQAEQNIDIVNYDINPANISDKFQNTKVFIRNVKPQ